MAPCRYLPLSLLLLLAGCGMVSSGPGKGGGSGSGGSGSATGSAAHVFVYVSSGQSSFQIDGFTVGSSGALTPVSGAPLATQGYGPLSMTSNGSLLFGTDGYSIDSLSIASDGSLKLIDSFKAGDLSSSSPPEPTGGPVDLFLNPSGSTLYDGFANLDGTENNGYQALNYNSGGAVSLIGNQGASPALGSALAFSSGGQFAYTSSCYHGTPRISAFSVGSNGSLTQMAGANFSAMPAAPSGDTYCPSGAASDSANHLILSVGVTPGDGLESTGPWQLAVYSIGASGSVSTSSTAASMPTTDVGPPTSYLLSPDGKYLAVGGAAGLQVFAYSAATGNISELGTSSVLTGADITEVAWDSADHLYALAPPSNSLYIYTVGTSGETPVSGSPYSVPGAYAMAVAGSGS